MDETTPTEPEPTPEPTPAPEPEGEDEDRSAGPSSHETSGQFPADEVRGGES